MYLVRLILNNIQINESDPHKLYAAIPSVGDDITYGFGEIPKTYRVEQRVFEFGGMGNLRDKNIVVDIHLTDKH